MLEKSKAEWFDASADEKRAAETLAHSYLVNELEQDLIPHEEAKRIVNGRMAAADEIWSRAVHGMLIGLRKAAID